MHIDARVRDVDIKRSHETRRSIFGGRLQVFDWFGRCMAFKNHSSDTSSRRCRASDIFRIRDGIPDQWFLVDHTCKKNFYNLACAGVWLKVISRMQEQDRRNVV